MKRDYIEIDRDSLEFLYAVYFGSYENEFQAAGNRAYRDMNRTMRFNGLQQEKRDNLRKQTMRIIQSQVDDLWQKESVDQKTYDFWHKNLSERMIALYEYGGVIFTVGQAQKWINMTMKYLYVLGKKHKGNCMIKTIVNIIIKLENIREIFTTFLLRLQKMTIPKILPYISGGENTSDRIKAGLYRH